MIKMVHVNKYFGSLHVLKDINLEVDKGGGGLRFGGILRIDVHGGLIGVVPAIVEGWGLLDGDGGLGLLAGTEGFAAALGLRGIGAQALEVLGEGLDGQVEGVGGVLQEAGGEDGLRAVEDGCDGGLGDAHDGIHRVGRGLLLAETANQEGRRVLGAVETGAEGLGALFAKEGVWVVLRGEGDDTHGHAGGEEEAHGADGGLDAGFVAVKDEVGGVRATAQERDVLGGEGGALRGDGGGEAADVAADDVYLALADDGASRDGLGDVGAGQVEGIERVGLLEDLGLGAVDVFAGVLGFAQEAAGEGDDAALRIADGEGQTAVETVVIVVAGHPRGGQHAGGDELIGREVVALGPFEERAMDVGRVADAEAFGGLAPEVATLQIVAGLLGLGGLLQAPTIEGGELLVDLVEAGTGLGLRVEALLDFYAGAFKKLLESGKIYPCNASRKEIAALSAKPKKKFDFAEPEKLFPAELRCACIKEFSPGDLEKTWRFKVPDGRKIEFFDNARGAQSFTAGEDFGDFVVWRKIGAPSYEFAVVADDAAMEITEVVRGEDLLLSTARQLLIYEALGFAPPQFYHCGLVLDKNGKKLSKSNMRAAPGNPYLIRNRNSI